MYHLESVWIDLELQLGHHLFSKWQAVGKELCVSFQQCSKTLLVDDYSEGMRRFTLSSLSIFIQCIVDYHKPICENAKHPIAGVCLF